MRPLRHVTALLRQCARQLADARRVVVGRIDLDVPVAVQHRESLQASLHERPALQIVVNVDSVEQMVAVARQPRHRLRPATTAQGGPHFVSQFLRRLQFCVRRADVRRPDRVKIDKQPAVTLDVLVVRRRHALQKSAALSLGKAVIIDLAQRDIEVLLTRIERLHGPQEGVRVPEVARHDHLAACRADAADLEHLPRLNQDAEGLSDPHDVHISS